MSCKCDTINIVNDNNVIVVSHADGRDGKSAYQQAVEGGYTGTEQDFNCSLSLLADVAEGKKQIADAINTKGGEASAESSFSQLAEDVLAMPTSGILANGITQTEPFSFLKYLTSDINNEITEINDSEITTIVRYYAFYKNITLSKISLPNLTTISGGNTFYGCSSLRSVELPNLTTISGGYTFQSCSSLQSVELPNLATISGGNTFDTCSSLRSVELPNLTTISGGYTFQSCSSLQSVELPNLATISGGNTFYGCSSLRSVEFGRLILIAESFYNKKGNLRNITIGAGTDVNLPFQYWTATNVIAEGQSGIDELNSNLYNNLLTKLYDHSEDGETRTLRLGWLAKVSQENIDYANSKGWTLTT
jgi:hypothetical protein